MDTVERLIKELIEMGLDYDLISVAVAHINEEQRKLDNNDYH